MNHSARTDMSKVTAYIGSTRGVLEVDLDKQFSDVLNDPGGQRVYDPPSAFVFMRSREDQKVSINGTTGVVTFEGPEPIPEFLVVGNYIGVGAASFMISALSVSGVPTVASPSAVASQPYRIEEAPNTIAISAAGAVTLAGPDTLEGAAVGRVFVVGSTEYPITAIAADGTITVTTAALVAATSDWYLKKPANSVSIATTGVATFTGESTPEAVDLVVNRKVIVGSTTYNIASVAAGVATLSPAPSAAVSGTYRLVALDDYVDNMGFKIQVDPTATPSATDTVDFQTILDTDHSWAGYSAGHFVRYGNDDLPCKRIRQSSTIRKFQLGAY